MLKNIAIILVISVFTATACMNSQADTNAANNNPAGKSTDGGAGSGESDGKNGKSDVKNENAKTFRGMINGIAFEMKLVRDGDKLSGSYFYTKIGKPLKLSGKIEKDGTFTLEESDDGGKKTGVWSGTWKEDENAAGITLEGSWKKPAESDDNALSFYATEQVLNFAGNVKFTDKTIKEKQDQKRSEILATYPEISGVESAEKFNSVIKNRVTELIDGYKKQLADYSEEDVKSLPAEMGLEQQIGYDVIMANNDFVSLLFSDYAFMGGAHGMTTYSPVNYDLKNNRELQLADIFEPNAAYLKTLSEYSIADLKKRVGEMSDDEWITKGAGAEKGNFSNWNLTKKGLLITFEPYQVAAYAAGSQTVIIPYDKLKSVLKKDGIVSQIAK